MAPGAILAGLDSATGVSPVREYPRGTLLTVVVPKLLYLIVIVSPLPNKLHVRFSEVMEAHSLC